MFLQALIVMCHIHISMIEIFDSVRVVYHIRYTIYSTTCYTHVQVQVHVYVCTHRNLPTQSSHNFLNQYYITRVNLGKDKNLGVLVPYPQAHIGSIQVIVAKYWADMIYFEPKSPIPFTLSWLSKDRLWILHQISWRWSVLESINSVVFWNSARRSFETRMEEVKNFKYWKSKYFLTVLGIQTTALSADSVVNNLYSWSPMYITTSMIVFETGRTINYSIRNINSLNKPMISWNNLKLKIGVPILSIGNIIQLKPCMHSTNESI